MVKPIGTRASRPSSSPPTAKRPISWPPASATTTSTSPLIGHYRPRRLRGHGHNAHSSTGALNALIEGDVLAITTLDRLGRSTQNMLAFADELRHRGAGLRVLNLGGENVDTSTPCERRRHHRCRRSRSLLF